MKESERSLPVRGRLERRHVVLGSAALLLIVIFTICEAGTDEGLSISFLYGIPVALTGLELGMSGGLGCAAAASVLIGAWMLTQHPELNTGDFILRAGTLFAIGAIAGRFSDRMRGARARQQQLLEAGLRLAGRAGQEDLPDLVARRVLELVPARGVHVAIEDLGDAHIGTLNGSRLMLELGPGAARSGILEVAERPGRPFTADERLSLELLALQISATVENQRLQVLEREQTALHSELIVARGELADQEHRLALFLNTHESERSAIAHELHDQAAQALAAIQVGLAAVERDLGSEPSRAQVELLREYLGETLRMLRDLAVSIRPPALDQLGLEPALVTLAERASGRSGNRITVEVTGLAGRLDPEIETAAYRLVDDILASARGDVTVRVEQDKAVDEVRIDAIVPADPDLLARVRARVELVGGRLIPDGERLAIVIPAQAEPTAEDLSRSR